MKIGGVDPRTLPNEEILVLPRGEQHIVFRAKALPNLDEFHTLCPEPVPPNKLTKDGLSPDFTDKGYRSVLEEYNKRRLSYMIVVSLEPSSIEWDTVNIDKPGSWINWEADLKNAGLSQVECNLVLRLVMEANSLDENKLKKAREVFLLGPQQASVKSGGPTTEPVSTPSGAPVSA
jgi:hypothetical protein